jgi:NADH-quinone oxidoreductase subunit N
VLNAIVALYYYLMVIKVMYVDRSADEEKAIVISAPYRWVLGITSFGVIFLGVIASPVYDWAVRAGLELLF